MERAKIISIKYEPSDTIEKQGKRKDIEKYIKAGYYIKEDRNGYWVLVKSAQVSVTLSNSWGTKTFNMKESICSYYKKERISHSLVDKFKDDIAKNKVSIYMDNEGYYTLR